MPTADPLSYMTDAFVAIARRAALDQIAVRATIRRSGAFLSRQSRPALHYPQKLTTARFAVLHRQRLCCSLHSRSGDIRATIAWARRHDRYGFRVAVHRPSARPSTFMRPPAESPSIQPARAAVTLSRLPVCPLGHSALKISSM